MDQQSKWQMIEEGLLAQKKQLEEQLASVQDNYINLVGVIPEASEPGTESWQASTHLQALAVKNNLINLSDKIEETLSRINCGTYGICEGCGQDIEIDRLKAIPFATSCTTCMNH